MTFILNLNKRLSQVGNVRMMLLLPLFFMLVLTPSCGTKSGSRGDAPKAPDSFGGNGPSPSRPEDIGSWQRIKTGLTTNLNGVSYMYDRGIFVVGDQGTLALSSDNGLSWQSLDVKTDADLNSISWVNNVFYIGGSDVILMSTDKGKTFVKAGEVKGNIRAMAYTSRGGRGSISFWAVGDAGLVLNAEVVGSDLDTFDPTALVWKRVDVKFEGNLTGVSMSFGRGLIVGDRGFLIETHDHGAKFEAVRALATQKNLTVIDAEVIGGDGLIARRRPVNGMPVGSYNWTLKAGTDYPTFTALECILDCMALGYDSSGSLILKIDSENVVTQRQAKYIPGYLRGITRGNKSYIAVGDKGSVLMQATE